MTNLAEMPLTRPDRRRPEPLWHQVVESVRAGASSGALAPGSQLPGEDRLGELLGVSRITIRHALAQLEALGVVRKEHGVGTFVRSPRLVAGARGLTSFTEEMAALGLRASTTTLDVRTVAADENVAAALHLGVGDEVLRIRRLRLGDDIPIGIQTAHLRPDRCPDLDAAAIGDRSLYEVLGERYGLRPYDAEEIYRVDAAVPGEAQLLQIRVRTPVFVVVRVTSDERGPFEYTRSTMRGDRYEIRSTLTVR